MTPMGWVMAFLAGYVALLGGLVWTLERRDLRRAAAHEARQAARAEVEARVAEFAAQLDEHDGPPAAWLDGR